MIRASVWALWVASVAGLAGCNKQAAATECTFDADCGEGAICEEGGTCRQVDCLTSSECSFGDYCAVDLDCPAGETCDVDSNTCEAYACRSTDLDCAFGEYCDDGDCKVDGRGHCEPCRTNGDCPGGECVTFESGQYCFIECNPNAELTCPRGYSCLDGVLYTNKAYCYADCPTLDDQGLL